MKKVLFCLTLLLLCLDCAWAAELPDSVKDAVPPEAADILPEMDASASHETLWQGLGDLWHSACAYVRTALETQASGAALLLGVVLVYLIMVAQFQSLLSPFIVLFTIPLAFTGGLLALWITGKELSVIAMLGFLMLAGVVVNNGIVFVDYANRLRQEGMARTEALIQTGRDRIRPILMTAMTTVFGLITMALGLGAGGDMLQPLAIVTIGGLTYATLLTLFIVPAIYDIFLKKDPKKIVIEEVEEV